MSASRSTCSTRASNISGYMDSQHILKKNTWEQRNAWCLTPWWGSNSPGVLALLVFVMAECLSLPTADQPLSVCSPVSSYRQAQLQSQQMWAGSCVWSSQSTGSSSPQGLTTHCGVNKPYISPILRDYTYIMLERKEAPGRINWEVKANCFHPYVNTQDRKSGKLN